MRAHVRPPPRRAARPSTARPELTGGRRSACCSATGSPARPPRCGPGASTSPRRGTPCRCRGCPGHGTTWQDMNKTTWADWYAEVERAFEALASQRRRRGLRALDGRRPGAAARRGPSRARSPGWCWSTRRWPPSASDVKLLPVLKHVVPSFPGIANDIKKPGVDEHGYARHAAARPPHSMFRAWPALAATCRRSPRRCCTSAPPWTTSSTPRRSPPITGQRVARATSTERMLEDSYHVATLDNDAARGSSRSPPSSSPGSPPPAPSRTPAWSRARRRPTARPVQPDSEDERLALDRRQLRRARRPSTPDEPELAGPSGRAAPRTPTRSRRRCEDEERFVPPPPPPLPRPHPRPARGLDRAVRRPAGAAGRAAAGHRTCRRGSATCWWRGSSAGSSTWWSQMPREPRDPGDDGARLSTVAGPAGLGCDA